MMMMTIIIKIALKTGTDRHDISSSDLLTLKLKLIDRLRETR